MPIRSLPCCRTMPSWSRIWCSVVWPWPARWSSGHEVCLPHPVAAEYPVRALAVAGARSGGRPTRPEDCRTGYRGAVAGRRGTAAAITQSLAPALCVTLGRFATAGEAQQLRQRLLVLDIAAEVRPREVVMGTDYWLVMPVVGGERHAVLQLSALQEQGVDSFLITQGEMAGQLSLGVFQRQDHAELRREQLQAQGHDAQVHALSRK